MSEFNKDKLYSFLGIVRKYMQVRGSLTQKDLAEMCDVGVSTMSRFLAKKTTDLNSQLIAKITASLNVPLHEMIDFVEESYADQFIRLVKFHKGDEGAAGPTPTGATDSKVEKDEATYGRRKDDFSDAFTDTLSTGTAQRNVDAKVNVGNKQTNIAFRGDQNNPNSEMSIKEKLDSLTPRQKAYMSDFLNLDIEGRDLIVDLGNDLFRYFRQKGMTI